MMEENIKVYLNQIDGIYLGSLTSGIYYRDNCVLVDRQPDIDDRNIYFCNMDYTTMPNTTVNNAALFVITILEGI